jgi:hypothetical protein
MCKNSATDKLLKKSAEIVISVYSLNEIEVKELAKKYLSHRSELCSERGCWTRASLGLSEEGDKYCVKHKKDGMKNVTDRKCKEKGCNKTPSYGNPNGIAEYCASHAKDGMIDVRNKKCKEKGCNTIPIFGFPDKGAECCGAHKEEGMIDLVHKTGMCQFDGCDTRASYGYEKNKGIFCVLHKKNNMIAIVGKICEEKGCEKCASYGLPNEGKKYCVSHKKKGMINVACKKCKKCDKQPSYGFPNGEMEYCVSHKEDGMVYIRNPTCQKCCTRAGFNSLGLPSAFCEKHAEKGMIANPTKRCSHKGCREIAIIGVYKPSYCEIHAPNIPEYKKMCKECPVCCCILHLTKNGKCVNCDETTKLIHKSELEMKENFIKNKLSYETYDKSLHICKDDKDRPDFLFTSKDKLRAIVVENDEEQHRGKKYQTCEIPRMINVHQQLLEDGYEKVLFIRFNPHKYKKDNKIVNPITSSRFSLLNKIIKKYINTENIFSLGVIFLYYDDFNKEKITEKQITHKNLL